MTPTEVLSRLEELGVDISERTLRQWAQRGLIPKPQVRSAGRGHGKVSDYPPATPAEAFASWHLLHNEELARSVGVRFTQPGVAGTRRQVPYYERELGIAADELRDERRGQIEVSFGVDEWEVGPGNLAITLRAWCIWGWLFNKLRIEAGFGPQQAIIIVYRPGGVREVRKSPTGKDVLRLTPQ